MGRNVAVLIAALAATAHADAPSFNGYSGEGLVIAVADAACPSQFINPVFPETFIPIDGNEDGTEMLDRFSGQWRDRRGLVAAEILPLSWWKNNDAASQSNIGRDLHNLMPGVGEVSALKRDIPLGAVTNPSWTDTHWAIGTTEVEGMEIECYMPAEEFRGDFARAAMYMAVVHPAVWWDTPARLLFNNNRYPILTAYGARLLMAWHRGDPVDSREQARNAAIRLIQGTGNPFVEYPQLAEYLWGEKAGEPFEVEGEAVPLRGVYRISDARIDLMSPHIPASATWTIDGRKALKTSYKPSELGTGLHTLRYSMPSGEHGAVVISIVP